MGTIFQRIPAMGDVFGRAPMLGEVRISGTSDVIRRHPDEGVRTYCDPSVDPDCSNPYEGPIPVQLEGDNRAFNASPSERETPPNLNCNVYWDAACPRPKPDQTLVPYVPSSYLRGSDHPVRMGQIEYHPPLVLRRRK